MRARCCSKRAESLGSTAVLHRSREGCGVASYFRSKSTEPLSHVTEVQDALELVMSQTRSEDWFVMINLKDAHFPSPSFPIAGSSWGLLWGQSVPTSGSSLRHYTLTLHFHEVCGCCTGSSVTRRHPHAHPHRHLVDISGWRMAVRQDLTPEKCAFSSAENHLSWPGVGFDHDAGTNVPCSDWVNPHSSQESEKRKKTSHSLSSSFRNCWVWWQLRPMWYILACCTWDPCNGGSRPRGSPRG